MGDDIRKFLVPDETKPRWLTRDEAPRYEPVERPAECLDCGEQLNHMGACPVCDREALADLGPDYGDEGPFAPAEET